MNKIRLLLIEDNRLLREGLRAMLARQKDISVIAASCEDAFEHALNQRKPHVVLLDLGLRNQKSLNMVEIVKREFPSAKIIVMDLASVQADILQFVKAGASGFILKDASLDEFLHTVRTVVGGGTVMPLLLTNSLFSLIIGDAVKGGKTGDALKTISRHIPMVHH
jgi:DNA-binding NarL/FixJ family response regulator